LVDPAQSGKAWEIRSFPHDRIPLLSSRHNSENKVGVMPMNVRIKIINMEDET